MSTGGQGLLLIQFGYAEGVGQFQRRVVPTLGKQSQATEPTLKALANCYAAIANAFSVGIDCIHLIPGLFQPGAEISQRLRRIQIEPVRGGYRSAEPVRGGYRSATNTRNAAGVR